MTTHALKPLVHVSMLALAMPTMAIEYPAPFDNAMNSVYGPRMDASAFHTGVDYLASAGTPAPVVADATLQFIRHYTTSPNKCGHRVFFRTKDGATLGYCHLFRESSNNPIVSGDFALWRDYPIFLGNLPPLRTPLIVKCNVVLALKTANALVGAQDCPFGVGRKITSSISGAAKTYAAKATVSAREPIGAVGNSGTGGAHLHVTRSRSIAPLGNPLSVVAHPNGSFCASLTAAGGAVCGNTVAPTISTNALAAAPFIEVRVDATNRLDLDRLNAQFSNAGNTYAVRYGGNEGDTPFASGNANIKNAIDLNCTKLPQVGQVIICPVSWSGQSAGGRLETKFRLGINPTLFPPGAYQLQVALTSITGQQSSHLLTFNVGGASAILMVPDTFSGWSGLPATINLTDFVPKTVVQFQLSANSSTCGGGERGAPLYSAAVPPDAVFNAAITVTGVPFISSGPGINRRNCSSFVAWKPVPNPANAGQVKNRIWINGTGRGQSFNPTVTLDWESQVRFDSGDPWTGQGRSCVGGTVPNSGVFVQAWSSSNCVATLTQ